MEVMELITITITITMAYRFPAARPASDNHNLDPHQHGEHHIIILHINDPQ